MLLINLFFVGSANNARRVANMSHQARAKYEYLTSARWLGPNRRTPEYMCWSDMRGRCNNVRHRDYPNYGGRGIRVCAEWDSFEAFLAHVGKRPSRACSIDRIDNDGGYEPGNVRWATKTTQQRNRRRRNVVPGHMDSVPDPQF